tara:strand:+ start:2905 stop:3162 length:258 start_codon:yes stop_codon:yes gene_type:complete
MIKSLSPKASMFATEQELREELTEKEYVYVKLAKLNEFIADLYHCTQYPNNEIIDANNTYNYINQIQQDLLRINRTSNNKKVLDK